MVGAESLDGRTRLTDRPIDSVAADLNSYDGDTLLARALKRARWSILWERLWPALATIATAVGLFFLLTAAAFAPFLTVRVPSRLDGLRRLDRNSNLQHRPATTISDELAA